MTVTLSFDIEEFDFPLERGREIDLEAQLDVSTEGLEALLALLERHGVPATFYITANYARHRPELVRRIAAEGHEVASHDYYHAVGSAADPAGAKTVLEEITGVSVAGYRSPRLAQISSGELAAAGYRYNSSMNPTWLPGRYNNLSRPRTVFTEGGILNYPMSVSWPFRVPLFWLSLHVMGLGLYRSLACSAIKKDGHLNLYFHPWEFSDRLADERFGVPAYISRCSGGKLSAKLDGLISYLHGKGYSFSTTRKYLLGDE